MRHATGWVGSCLVRIVLAAQPAYAAGFALFEHSGRGLGSAFAGEAAVAGDAGTVYFKPAGLTLLSGTQPLGDARRAFLAVVALLHGERPRGVEHWETNLLP